MPRNSDWYKDSNMSYLSNSFPLLSNFSNETRHFRSITDLQTLFGIVSNNNRTAAAHDTKSFRISDLVLTRESTGCSVLISVGIESKKAICSCVAVFDSTLKALQKLHASSCTVVPFEIASDAHRIKSGSRDLIYSVPLCLAASWSTSNELGSNLTPRLWRTPHQNAFCAKALHWRTKFV